MLMRVLFKRIVDRLSLLTIGYIITLYNLPGNAIPLIVFE